MSDNATRADHFCKVILLYNAAKEPDFESAHTKFSGIAGIKWIIQTVIQY